MNAPRLFCGIDPGVNGAVGLVREDASFADVKDVPVLTTTTGRRAVDPAGLAAILRQYHPVFTLVERVGPRPGEGAVGAFAFGLVYGAILATLATLGPAHDVVQPCLMEAPGRHPAWRPEGCQHRASHPAVTGRRHRDAEMRHERMTGMTLRALAMRYRLSKSQVHRVVGDLPITPPAPIHRLELVPLNGGGYTWRHITPLPARQRAYRVRNHRRLYAGMA